MTTTTLTIVISRPWYTETILYLAHLLNTGADQERPFELTAQEDYAKSVCKALDMFLDTFEVSDEELKVLRKAERLLQKMGDR